MNEALLRALESGQDYATAVVEAAAPMREIIRAALERQPFQPFRLRLTDRSIHEIRNPEDVELTPSTVQISFPDPSAPKSSRLRRILALIHVVSLEVMAADEPAIVQGKEMK
jgi:hypothetical protein